MAQTLTVGSSSIGTALKQVLMCDDIQPGSSPSYEICKLIYLYHPVGQKMAEAPIKMAMRLPRTIKVTDGPEDDLVKAFNEQYERDDVHRTIRALATLARVYGTASVGIVEKGADSSQPLDPAKLADADLSFNVFDPLNTAGSLVLDQNPNSLLFQKHVGISVAGQTYHRSRAVTLFNEQPIYLAYSNASFGFSGRSVYQRALYPLKSFINTMNADDMVARKAGLLVATIKQAGSIINNIMNASAAFKRNILKLAETDNVISINDGETVESINLNNLEGPLSAAKRSIIENIATAGDMPAKILLQETFAEGFGEGIEDANYVADFLDEMRIWLSPAYRFFDNIVMRRAWNPRLHKSLLDKYGSDIGADYEEAFYRWKNSFEVVWPSLRREPEINRVSIEDMKIKDMLAVTQMIMPMCDGENLAEVLDWLQDNLNGTKSLFTNDLQLDTEAMAAMAEKTRLEAAEAAAEGEEGGEEAKTDGAVSSFLSSPSTLDIRQKIANIEHYMQKNRRMRR